MNEEAQLVKPYNQNLCKLLQLAREMLALSEQGDRDRQDQSCGILYGILRDTAYRLKKLAEEECDNHKKSGRWD